MGLRPSQILPDLQHSQYVFIRRNTHHTPLQHPYEGPFKVLQPGEKNFTIEIGGRKDTVSVDGLKPAHLDPEFQVPVAEAKHRGRPPKKVQPTLTQSHTPDILSHTPLPLHTRSGSHTPDILSHTPLPLHTRSGSHTPDILSHAPLPLHTRSGSHTPDILSHAPLPLHTRSGHQVNYPRRFISVLGGAV